MHSFRQAVALLVGATLALAACGDDPRPQTCDPDYSDVEGGCTLGALVGRLELAEGSQARTTVSLAIGADGGGRTVEFVQASGGGPFSFEKLEQGEWLLALHAEGHVGQSLTVLVAAGQTKDVGTIVLEVDPKRPASIEGKILLRDAAAHGGTLVHLDESTLRVATAPDGSFRFADVPPGSHTLHARHDGYAPLDHSIFLERGPNPLEFTMDPLEGVGSLSGKVTHAGTGAPLEGASISVGGSYAATSGADGAYVVSDVPRGTYEVRVSHSGFMTLVADGVSVVPNATTSRDFALTEGDESARLFGVATRMHAAPGANGGISVRVLGTELETTTDGDGRWRFAEAPAGRFDVAVEDERFPPATIRGVVVSDGRQTRAPDVVLGPAKKILDGLATSSRIFASRRKAVVATPQGTHLFDAARSTLTRLSGESLEVIAVDAQQRWATLKGAGSLFRLDVVQGTIESVQVPRFTSLVSDRAMTIFVGDDGVLHALVAGETVTLSLQTVGDGTVSVGQRLDEVRGWRTVVAFSSQGVWEIPVDFGGWVGGAGSSVVAGSVPGRVATFGPWIAGQGRSLTWADLATHSTIPVATGMDDYDLWRNVVTFVEGSTLAALDIDTGAVSPLLSGVAPAVDWLSNGAAVARRSGGLRWLSSAPPSSGILCADPRGEARSGDVFACVDGPSPHQLRVVDSSGLASTWSSDAVTLPAIDDDGLVSWNDSDGLLHVRLDGFAADLTIACAAADANLALDKESILRRLVRATCQTQEGSSLLDFAAGRVWQFSQAIDRCSVDPGGGLAVCRHATSGDVVAYDTLGNSQVVSVGGTRLSVVWGADGGAAVRTGAGAYHANGLQVTACAIPDSLPVKAAEEFSLWFDIAGNAYVCGSDGSVSEPFVPWTGGIARIGSSQRYFYGGWLVDLADGSVEHLVPEYGYEIPCPGGSLITSAWGLVRVPETGEPQWIVEDRKIQYLSPGVPWAGFLAGEPTDFDLLVADAAGSVSTLLEGGVEFSVAGDASLAFHAPGDDGRSVAVIDSAANLTFVPYRVGDSWQVEADRLFFDTPTVEGVAFATTHLGTGTSSILHPTAGGKPIGVGGDGRWIFVADGWTWQETAAGTRSVIAGKSTLVQAAEAGTIVFHATAPDATYWLEGD